MAGQLWTTKDLARYMGLSPRRVKRWWKRLRVQPDACARNGLHRWTETAVRKLMAKWRGKWNAKGLAPETAHEKFAGRLKAAREKRQLQLKLIFK